MVSSVPILALSKFMVPSLQWGESATSHPTASPALPLGCWHVPGLLSAFFLSSTMEPGSYIRVLVLLRPNPVHDTLTSSLSLAGQEPYLVFARIEGMNVTPFGLHSRLVICHPLWATLLGWLLIFSSSPLSRYNSQGPSSSASTILQSIPLLLSFENARSIFI